MQNDREEPAQRPAGKDHEPRPALTVIIPVFNEEGNLDSLYGRLKDTLQQYGRSYEILFIEDGSTDDSFEGLKRLHDHDPAVRVVRFARNFGQQMAVSAGFQYARGEVVVLMDADLQVAPEEIPPLADKLAEGYDIVYGVRTQRLGSLLRRMGSWGMSHLLYRVTGIDIPDSATGFLACNRGFVDTIKLFNEKSKYLNGLFAWLSYGRWASVAVKHAPRHTGESKYTTAKLVGLTLNFVCNFSTLPLRLILYLGVCIALISVAGLVGLLAATLLGYGAGHGSTWLIVLALGLFSGVQLAAVGTVGEYLGRVYREVKEQPAYVVREILERDGPPVG